MKMINKIIENNKSYNMHKYNTSDNKLNLSQSRSINSNVLNSNRSHHKDSMESNYHKQSIESLINGNRCNINNR